MKETRNFIGNYQIVTSDLCVGVAEVRGPEVEEIVFFQGDEALPYLDLTPLEILDKLKAEGIISGPTSKEGLGRIAECLKLLRGIEEAGIGAPPDERTAEDLCEARHRLHRVLSRFGFTEEAGKLFQVGEVSGR